MGVLIEAGGVNGGTEVDLDTRTKELGVGNTEDTRVGDLTLDESRAIELELGTNFKSNSIAARSITRGLAL